MLNRYKCNLEHEIMNGIFSFFIRFLHIPSCIYWNFDGIFSMYSCNYIIYKLYNTLFGYFIFYKIIIYNNCHFGFVGKYFPLKSELVTCTKFSDHRLALKLAQITAISL